MEGRFRRVGGAVAIGCPLRGLHAAEGGGVSDHIAACLGHLAGIVGGHGVAGGVLAGGGAGVLCGGGVADHGVALAIRLSGIAPLGVRQGECTALVLHRLGDEGQVSLR